MQAILLPDSLLARQPARCNQSVINCVRRQSEWQQKSTPGTPDALGLSADVERRNAQARRHASPRPKHQVSGQMDGSSASDAFCALIRVTASSGA